MKIAPSILSADFAALGEEIARVETAGADQLHIDVMDGRFVPNITIGPVVVAAIRKRSRLPLDVHLMIVEPERYLADFARAGADMLTVHAEACPHLQRTLVQIRELGAKAGVALNPGFGGQKFIPGAYAKIRQVRTMAGARPVEVSVDGGVKLEHARPLAEHGASILVAGSAIFEAPDPAAMVKRLRSAAEAPG